MRRQGAGKQAVGCEETQGRRFLCDPGNLPNPSGLRGLPKRAKTMGKVTGGLRLKRRA